MQLSGFSGKGAFVTGAAGGIGQALVVSLRQAGAKVFATDLPQALASLPPELAKDVIWRPLDVGDPSAASETIAEAGRMVGPIGLGAHAAGVLSTQPLLSMSGDEWHDIFQTNTAGAFHVLRGLGQHMSAQNAGAIVVIGSNAGGIPRMNMGGYAASKAATAMLTRCFGLELASRNIRCNLVAPGSTLTPMQTGMWGDDTGAGPVIAGDLASFRTGIPLGKLATAQDIANAVMFLLSDMAGHITMTDLYVDGGATLRG